MNGNGENVFESQIYDLHYHRGEATGEQDLELTVGPFGEGEDAKRPFSDKLQ